MFLEIRLNITFELFLTRWWCSECLDSNFQQLWFKKKRFNSNPRAYDLNAPVIIKNISIRTTSLDSFDEFKLLWINSNHKRLSDVYISNESWFGVLNVCWLTVVFFAWFICVIKKKNPVSLRLPDRWTQVRLFPGQGKAIQIQNWQTGSDPWLGWGSSPGKCTFFL